jgi:hypothetical protein
MTYQSLEITTSTVNLPLLVITNVIVTIIKSTTTVSHHRHYFNKHVLREAMHTAEPDCLTLLEPVCVAWESSQVGTFAG